MNETLDQLLAKLTFVLILGIVIIIYRIIDSFISSRNKTFWHKHYPMDNPAHTIHLFSRLMGLAIIFSSLTFYKNSLYLSIIHFLIWSIVGLLIYLISVYILENIILYNFHYYDEVLKKQNLSYALISGVTAISVALVLKKVLHESEASLLILSMLWLTSLVLLGFATKFYPLISYFKFNSHMIQKSVPLALSYGGFLMGCAIIVSTTFSHDHFDIKIYASHVVLKSILALIIYPLFYQIIIKVFLIDSTLDLKLIEKKGSLKSLGLGAYECLCFLTVSLLTAIIIDKVKLGTIYPFFD